MIKYQLHHYN